MSRLPSAVEAHDAIEQAYKTIKDTKEVVSGWEDIIQQFYDLRYEAEGVMSRILDIVDDGHVDAQGHAETQQLIDKLNYMRKDLADLCKTWKTKGSEASCSGGRDATPASSANPTALNTPLSGNETVALFNTFVKSRSDSNEATTPTDQAQPQYAESSTAPVAESSTAPVRYGPSTTPTDPSLNRPYKKTRRELAEELEMVKAKNLNWAMNTAPWTRICVLACGRYFLETCSSFFAQAHLMSPSIIGVLLTDYSPKQ